MDIAIDMGCERTRVFVPNKGKVLDEASVVTYDIDTEEIFAVGNEAYKTIGKTPYGIEAVHPLEKGVIAHSELAEDMMSIFIKELSEGVAELVWRDNVERSDSGKNETAKEKQH